MKNISGYSIQSFCVSYLMYMFLMTNLSSLKFNSSERGILLFKNDSQIVLNRSLNSISSQLISNFSTNSFICLIGDQKS